MQRPQDMSKKGKACQVYHVHVDGIDDGSLLDSAADVHVSGINPDFTLKKKLTNPPISTWRLPVNQPTSLVSVV
ncbi:hypothetical protein O181_042257 [Austropuccinia psidii MF-1]|uniref:Uncharacterized protein n=1 Tax=Austropuccinia psidii MF-1 TaxID=1389203 RepID=A0A9Q3HFP8_9BASI|nr:hypothetical protein [Austropuccinia psidii MF-1]